MVIKATIIKVLFAEMYGNVVIVIRCLYSAVSLTLTKGGNSPHPSLRCLLRYLGILCLWSSLQQLFERTVIAIRKDCHSVCNKHKLFIDSKVLDKVFYISLYSTRISLYLLVTNNGLAWGFTGCFVHSVPVSWRAGRAIMGFLLCCDV